MGIKIEGMGKLLKAVKALEKRAVKDASESVTVGFVQTYAIFVHEDRTAHHTVGEAGFLAKAATAFRPALAQDITNEVKGGKPLKRALLSAGRILLRAAQDITPVDTGALKGSGFVTDTKNEDQAAEQAFGKSELIRQTAIGRRTRKRFRSKK